MDTVQTRDMTQTGILAARINRNDDIEVEGQGKTVDDYTLMACGTRIRFDFTDGTSYTTTPQRYVTAWI